MLKKINTRFIIIMLVFLFGLYFCLNYKSGDLVEEFSTMRNCPNLLIKKGKELHLMNTRKAVVPGVNPVKFDSLEDYAEYVKWAKRVGIKCPILYYEQTYNTQNERGYRLLDDPLCPKAGLPSNDFAPRQAPQQLLTDANRDDPPYNQNNFAGFDAEDQYVGSKTPLDGVTLQTNEGSYSPMDPNWAGGRYTQKAVDNGVFLERTRKIQNPVDSKTNKPMRRRY